MGMIVTKTPFSRVFRSRSTGQYTRVDGWNYETLVDPKRPASLLDVERRLKENKKVWRAFESFVLDTPSNFEGDRFQNDQMPLPGKAGKGKPPSASWYGGGYEGRLKIRIGKKGFRITSDRPYTPMLNDQAIDTITSALEKWWLGGTV